MTAKISRTGYGTGWREKASTIDDDDDGLLPYAIIYYFHFDLFSLSLSTLWTDSTQAVENDGLIDL